MLSFLLMFFLLILQEDQSSIESRFMTIIQGMNLSHLETAALRLAIARDDSTIRRALDVFRVDLNEQNLINTLRIVSRQTIAQTMQENGFDDGNDDGDENSEESEEQEEEKDEEEVDEDDDDYEDDEDDLEFKRRIREIREGRGHSNASATLEDDEEDEEEEEDDDEEEEEEEEEPDRVLTSQAAREKVFPMLITELVRESIISTNDQAVLLTLFQQQHPVISAALDVYDLDHDMSDLVDTLQRAVSSAQ